MKHKLFILISFIFLSGMAFGQPGWQDFTPRYFYTVLDEKEEEISFKNNKNYSIMIDDVLYLSPNIPQDSLKPAKENLYRFSTLIRINDFSLAIPPPEDIYKKQEKRLEIKIIHKKDTMFICQPSGTGSIGEWTVEGKKLINKSDFTLPFQAGHYYFPHWIQDKFDRLPKTSGNVTFLNTANLNRQYFIISPESYESYLQYRTKNAFNQEEADDYVVDHYFTKGHLAVEKKTAFTKFEQLLVTNSWLSTIHPTKDSHLFWGMTGYSGSNFSTKRTFATLNKKENSIMLFLPEKDPNLFNCEDPYVDNFTSTIYLPVWIKQKFNENEMSVVEYNKLPTDKYIYSSKDEGLTWQKDKKAQAIFEKYAIFDRYKYRRKIEFIDKYYAVVYYQEVIERDEKTNRTQLQGVYYLLKNMQVIDSLKSPEDAPFYGNYGESSRLSVQDGKLVLLGSWTYDYDKTYFEMSLNKVNKKWKFQVEKKYYAQIATSQSKQKTSEKDSIKYYKNFQLINNQELVFKNGSGQMKLYDEVSDNSIIEKDNQIYIISNSSVYLSLDGGANWYLYPASLLPNSYHFLLDINDQNEICYFTNAAIDEGGSKTRKISYKFSLE